ncbi:amino acid ABC transporter permease [Scatolibacter rhodanostii]|uniref:amino acid ABC transporter permease n=1 Tax=Scatolibacter rhodanostii TaxID=2014781 RepID=UPI000C08CDC8|nr:amino acid ABC transporter permease [Scatolibacter rhodanostii]
MNLEFIQKYANLYVHAAGLTLRLALIGILLSILVGFLCSLVQYYKIPVLRKIIGAYIELSRNTPLVVQLFFLYFGLPKLGIRISSETCAIIGLTFLGGSYMSEAFRSGLESIDKIQTESALSLGFSRFQVMRYILLPQAVAISVPAFAANVIFLIKETSVFSIVALADLMYVAKDLMGLYHKTTESLFMLVIGYLVILLPISILATLLERRLRYAGFGNQSTI